MTARQNDMAMTAINLLGRTPDDDRLKAFLTSIDAWPPPAFAPDESTSSYVDKDQGFELTFQDAKIVEHPSAKGLAPRTPVFVTIFFFGKGQEDYSPYKGTLPKGIEWTDTSESLIAKLGQPSHTIHNKKSGALKAHTWPIENATLTTMFDRNGALVRVDAGI